LTQLDFSIDQTSERMKIEITPEGDKPAAEIVLSTYELDTVILNLAKARAKMKPEIPRTLDPRPVFKNVVSGAMFHISPGASGPQAKVDVVIAVAHPGMGWIAFPMPVADALKLSEAIGLMALKVSQRAPLVGPDGKPL
jgi:hypothetical protein